MMPRFWSKQQGVGGVGATGVVDMVSVVGGTADRRGRVVVFALPVWVDTT